MGVVCIVEDQRSVALGMERILSKGGHRVSIYEDGLDAYVRIVESPPDLVVLDVLLPSLHGLALARLLKFNEELRHVRILLVSSVTPDVDALAAQVGVDALLPKPFDAGAFEREVSRLLDDHASTIPIGRVPL